MEETQVVESQGQATSTPAPSATPAAAPASTQATGNDRGNGAQAAKGTEGVTPVDAYTPSFKYKASVKDPAINDWVKKELEMDEWVRPVVKSKEQEERLKELYEKANGLDLVKESREKDRAQLNQVATAYSQLHSEVSDIMSHVKEKDFGTAFQKMGVSEQDVLNYFIEKHNMSQLPPEQQKLYNERNQFKNQDREWQNKFQSLEQQYRQMEVRTLNYEVQSAMQNPEVQDVQKNYDQSMGRDGAFKELVKDMALAMFNQTGQDPTAEQAIRYTIQRMGNAYRSQPANAGGLAQPNGEKPLPVIPRVSGANMSPTKKSPRSLDDLRKMAAERANG